MNVCHFISSKGLGRGEFYIDLVNEMSQNSFYNITLLVPCNSKFIKRVSKNINIIEYKSKDSRNNLLLYFELFKIFKSNNFTIVHTHFAKSTEIFYRLNKFLKKIHIATKHNPRKGKIFNKIKYVTAVSNDVKKSIKNKNTAVIHNGISIKEKIIENEKNNIFTIRVIGRLEKVKGFDLLIKDLKNLSENFILEIIGDGKELENLNLLIKDLNLSKKVKLLGYKENIPELIATADLIIISSLSEGFSLVALETLYYGKLLLSTNVGICKEILSDNFLIKDYIFSNKVKDIIENYKNYISEFQLIKESNMNSFLLEHITEEYFKYYERILELENCNN